MDEFFEDLLEEQRAQVEAACVDMSPSLLSSLKRNNLSNCEEKVVHDAFHLVKHMNETVNDTCKVERIKGTCQLWLFGEENPEAGHLGRFEALEDLSPKTGLALSIKEVFREFLGSCEREEAEESFELWYQWAIRFRLPAIEKVARMCKKHLDRILNYFDHKISNGPIEGLNSRIQGLTNKAFGYRNKERFKNDIYFHLGGLENP